MSFRIGQMVYVGYCPDRYCKAGGGNARLQTGTIAAGPFDPGWQITNSGGGRFAEHSWDVDADSGCKVRVAQSLLFPIDDDPARVKKEGNKLHV